MCETSKSHQDLMKFFWDIMLFISIFVLDIYNTKMKKLIIVIVISFVIIIGILVFMTTEASTKNDLLQSSSVLIIVIGFGMLVLFRRFISIKKGEPTEDELSKLILQKTASLSFYISLYLWLIISYFSDKINIEIEELIGYGIIGMAIIFISIWSFLKIKGFKND